MSLPLGQKRINGFKAVKVFGLKRNQAVIFFRIVNLTNNGYCPERSSGVLFLERRIQ
jgi:hypothetical protein